MNTMLMDSEVVNFVLKYGSRKIAQVYLTVKSTIPKSCGVFYAVLNTLFLEKRNQLHEKLYKVHIDFELSCENFV